MDYIVNGYEENIKRFWDALHSFADGSNDWKRQPIVIMSCNSVVTVNKDLTGADSLLKVIALAAGVNLTPVYPQKYVSEMQEMLAYFLQCFDKGNMTITGLDVTKLRWLVDGSYLK
jgi:hypothetical protein